MTLKSILLTVLSYWNKKKNLSKTTSNLLADAWFNGRFKSKRLQESRLHNNEDKTMLVTKFRAGSEMFVHTDVIWHLTITPYIYTDKLSLVSGRGPLAKIISLRGNPLGNRFSVVQCIVP
jgi:hypothetical protein